MLTTPETVRAFLEDRHVELHETVGAFCDAEIATLPHVIDDEVARAQAREIAARIGAAGLVRHAHEQDLRACCLVRERLGYISPLADSVYALQCLGSTPILLSGSEAPSARWLTEVAEGRAIAAFAMTEREAGSDVSSMQTTARRDGDSYVLNGQKTLISNAGIADFYTVFASTDASRGTRGISCFVVAADTPGFRFVGAQKLSAPHPLGEIAFDDCRVSADCRLGAEGEGFKLGMATLDRLRPTVGAAACGMAARALDEAARHAVTRRQFGKPLAEFQLIQEKIAQMAVDLTASRLLVYRAAWEKDSGADRITLSAAMAKSFSTEAAQRIVDQALQILGGRGVLADNPVELLYRSVRALRIYEGTTEIQHLIIARQILSRYERDVATS
jgi:acyl-CoA dehydrogenase